ncbi:MAG TPA: NUDIX hydrolase [Mycobacteriales bacterium]|jgi:8-oxo-dGTP pyrophosphatase MutT (NUDIX family)|nr:NUDIX hydrolase [Mycobacteriales bacterium]
MARRFSPWRRGLHQAFLALPRTVRKRVVRVATPNYTVGSVVLLRDGGGALLLLRQPPGGDGWSLPGGLLDRFEHPAAGALRELEEETGVRLDPAELRPAEPNAVVAPRVQQVDCVFTATVDPAALDLDVDPVEVLEARWFPADALPRLTAPTARLLAHYGLAAV